MRWPDIFFRARKPRPGSERPRPLQPAPESPKAALPESAPSAIKPVFTALGAQVATTSAPLKIGPVEAGTRTLAAMHGVVLRPPEKPAESTPTKAKPHPPSEASSPSKPIAAAPFPLEAPKADPVLVLQVPVSSPISPGTSSASTPKTIPPASPVTRSLTPFGFIFRRKAKMTEVARIVLPSKREEPKPPPPPSESSSSVVPPAFPIAAMTARARQPAAEDRKTVKDAAHDDNMEVSPPDKAPGVAPGAEKPASPEMAPTSTPTPVADAKPAVPLPDLSDAPKVDPEAHKPEPSAAPLPKVDPEAHKPPPKPAAPVPATELGTPTAMPEKRDFHLANGERVAGTVLSETPEAVYIEHGTLGVLTIPRAQIARRLVEIILINGDRIVGDIMAETADTLYVRHASLGMLTVPRAQRSTRVVEAILKDGDRILGEVLTETDSFTVIRSATLGTVTVPHGKISMLNRKIEQIELKALPPPAPEIKDKPAG